MKKVLVLIAAFCLLSIAVFGSELRILTTEEAPTNYTYAGEFTGTSVDIVKEIKRVIGEDAKIEVYPWARSYHIAKTTPNVAIFTAGKTQERVDLGFNFVGPVFTRDHILYKKAGSNVSADDIKDVLAKDYKIGCMRDDWRSKYFKKEGAIVEEVVSQNQNLRKLMFGRIDLWALSDIEAPSVVSEAGYTMDDIEPVYTYSVGSSYIMLSKGTPQNTVKEWRDALSYIETTDFFDKTTEKWSGILGLDLGYSSDKGIYIKR